MSRNQNALDVPAATRAKSPGWRDPRMWVGVALVAVSVVVGARVAGSEDDSVQVWAADKNLAAGETLDPDQLVPVRVDFAAEPDLERYLRVDEPLPSELNLVRPVSSGELVPTAAFGEADTEGQVRVSLSLPESQVPTGIVAGATVDVWVVVEGASGKARARHVLDDAPVLAVPRQKGAFGETGGARQIVIGVDELDTDALGVVLAATGTDSVRIVSGGAAR